MSSVAILHDRIPGIGGGETVAIEAARVLDAPLYTTYVTTGTDLPDDIDVIPFRQDKYTTTPWKHVLEWSGEGMNPVETLNVALDLTDGPDDLSEYDIILESGPLSKFYVPTVDQRIVHYPHSPPRWLYDLYRDRLASFEYPFIESMVKLYAKLWRTFDKEANDYVDTFIANSELIERRINRFYDRDATVIYPPVTGEWRNEGDEGYFLTWSRLIPDKRTSLIAKAFSDLEDRLVIAGDGPERDTIQQLAASNDNIEYRGFVEDIQSLVATCTAVIYAPKQEDFGLVGAEALVAGKPLLGVNEGFTRYQVDPGTTGLLFEPTVKDIRRVVREFDPAQFDTADIQARASKYKYETFEQALTELITQYE